MDRRLHHEISLDDRGEKVENAKTQPVSVTGLTETEAAARLAAEGTNELPSTKGRNVLAIAFDVIREPMFILLVGCGAIYLLLGDLQEALMLLGFVFVVMGITLYQERKTERALEALRDLSSPRALVIREGVERRIAGREIVREDVLLLREGDRVPADAILLAASNLTIDESLLTGESVPVRKSPPSEASSESAVPVDAGRTSEAEVPRPGGDDLPYVYSGTLVVRGHGVARVVATGIKSELGRIGKTLQEADSGKTRLQAETGILVRNMAILGITLCAIVVVVYGLTRGDWLHGFLAGITLAMATLPEEFPVVLTIFLALGAWRISQQHVLTRRVPAIETLGSATVFCVDKTGTLTMNRMSVRAVSTGDHPASLEPDGTPTAGALSDPEGEILFYGGLASNASGFDPMDRAIQLAGERNVSRMIAAHREWIPLIEYPLTTGILALSNVWDPVSGDRLLIAAKGAPEAIADLCHMDEEERRKLDQRVTAMASGGLRVLGVARAEHPRTARLPEDQHAFPFEFIGLIGLADPIRPAVPAAIRECYTAGIRVVMITGDYPATAQNVARQIGLKNSENVITGPEMDAMSDADLVGRVRDVNICARVVPEQKLRLVNALKQNGEIVAMTGDGVNDAPALKAANIGIAMGARGTDVAREAASLVLLDEDFSSIVHAIRLGRRIFDNIKKAIAYIFAIHVPIAGMSLLPVILRWPLVLLPVHIVFLELIIDPACSVVFEAEPADADVMQRKPRDPKSRLFDRRTLGFSVLQGLSVLAIVLAVWIIALHRGSGETEARALTFTTLIVANLGLIMTNRSWSRTIFGTIRERNVALWWVAGGAIVFLGLVLYVPHLRTLFRFGTLHATDLAICLVAGAVSILWFEALKRFGITRFSGA
jgi:P-type Ca2+ transporter type 2C